jgi:hypothetical protein
MDCKPQRTVRLFMVSPRGEFNLRRSTHTNPSPCMVYTIAGKRHLRAGPLLIQRPHTVTGLNPYGGSAIPRIFAEPEPYEIPRRRSCYVPLRPAPTPVLSCAAVVCSVPLVPVGVDMPSFAPWCVHAGVQTCPADFGSTASAALAVLPTGDWLGALACGEVGAVSLGKCLALDMSIVTSVSRDPRSCETSGL